MRRIDDMVASNEFPPPNFIKCDVEGAEILVFKGAMKTINRVNAPVILFEANSRAASAFGTSVTEYLEFLESMTFANYSFFEVMPDGLHSLPNELKEFSNVVAVPENRNQAR